MPSAGSGFAGNSAASGVFRSWCFASGRQDTRASLEAAAREARYGVLASYPADFIVLAQHRDDQAETRLLQLLRGAGVKGLSAMPLVRPLAPEVSGDLSRFAIRNPLLLRPLLGVTRNAIEAYAGRRRLEWMEDESNEDTALDRNYLRWRVLPLLAARFPGYREALSRAADHFAEAAELLGDLAAIDGGEGIPGNTLPLAILRGLPKSRAKNLLRHFLAANGVPFPSAVRLEELLRQLRTAGADSKVRIAVGEFDVRCFRGGAYVLRMRATVPRSSSSGGGAKSGFPSIRCPGLSHSGSGRALASAGTGSPRSR